MKQQMVKRSKKQKCFELFFTFLKIGAFTFGGGYAMIPFIKREIVEKKGWLEEGDILDIIAVSESTPGPIAINAATFVGSQVAGFWGAFGATLGVVIPSFSIILILSFFLRAFASLEVVTYAFNGIRVGVLVLVLNALVSMAKQCPQNKVSYFIVAFAFLLVTIFDVNIIAVMICCALIGLAASRTSAGGRKL